MSRGNRNLQNHIASDAMKWFVCFLLIFVIIAGMALGALELWTDKGPSTWGKDAEQTEKLPNDKKNDDKDGDKATGGVVIPDTVEGNGIALMSAVIPVELYEEYGISPAAETAYQLTARLEPSDATGIALNWSVAFVSGEGDQWGNGKTVTDYVKVTPVAEDVFTANVECLQAFGEQIIVKVEVVGKEIVTATCPVDYAKKLVGITVTQRYNAESIEFTQDQANAVSCTNNASAPLQGYFFFVPSFSDVYTKDDNYRFSLEGGIPFQYDKEFLAKFIEFARSSSYYSVLKNFVNNALSENFLGETLSSSSSGSAQQVPALYLGSLMSFLYLTARNTVNMKDATSVNSLIKLFHEFQQSDSNTSAWFHIRGYIAGNYSRFDFDIPFTFSDDYFALSATGATFNKSGITF